MHKTIRQSGIVFSGIIAACLVLLLVVFGGFAQSTPTESSACEGLVQQALQTTDRQCGGITRNQACYGHEQNEVVGIPGIKQIRFDAQGDRIGLAQMQSLRLSGLDVAENVWGVVLMQAQASLPDVLPGQNVTFVLFGDVEVDNAIGSPRQQVAAVLADVVILANPDPDAMALADLAEGDKFLSSAKAVLADGTVWIRGAPSGQVDLIGWLRASDVSVNALRLPDTAPDLPAPRPFQAFYLRTGIGVPTCVEAPPDGILMQSPSGSGKVSFTVNGIDVALGSTGFITHRGDTPGTCISLITGDADVKTGLGAVNLDPGQRTCVDSRPDGSGPGAPSQPELYDASEIERVLPILDLLPVPVDELPDVPTYTPTPTATNTPRPTLVPPTRTKTPTQAATAIPPPADTAIPVSTVPPTTIPPTRVRPTAAPCTPGPGPRKPCVTETPFPTNTPQPPSVGVQFALSVLTVNFSVSNAGGPIDTYAWDFGDLNTSTAASPAHTYAVGGTYLVNVTTSNVGGSSSSSATVIIPNCNFDGSIPAQISFERDATDLTGTLYAVYFKDADCNPVGTPVSVLSVSNPTTGALSAFAGQHWFAMRTDGTPTLWDQFIIPATGGTFMRFLTDGV